MSKANVFVKELFIGILLMIGTVAAGIAFRAAHGVSFADFPTLGLIKGVLIGGLCLGIAFTSQRMRR